LSGPLASILVPGLFGAELFDEGQALSLHADEERAVAGAADKRRRDFALGRTCAHAALALLNRDAGPITRASDGAPAWPAGIVGSITHTQGYGAAVVAVAADFAGLGVDAERIGGVTQDLWPRLFGTSERDDLSRQPDPARLATTLFSAKEACHKAGRERVLRFHDLHVTPGENHFTAQRGAEMFAGRSAVHDDLVVTIAWQRWSKVLSDGIGAAHPSTGSG
jgi:4'-phosphopantetheinyl transferase EntD